MHISQYPVGPLQTNCYIVRCEESQSTVIIDPGDITQDLLAEVEKHPVSAILLTHGHFDHIAGIKVLQEKTTAPVYIHADDRAMLTDSMLNGSYLLGVDLAFDIEPLLLSHGDTVSFGNSMLTVRHTPGHSPGGISFVGDDFVVVGDTLFRYSIGRWDLSGGNYQTLIQSITTQLVSLPENTRVYPGHGDPTEISFEKTHNEFLRGA